MNNQKIYLQLTAGRGPAECCRAVALILEKIIYQANSKGIKTEIIEREEGEINRTLFSAVILLDGKESREIAEE
ncbi:MAG: hypothetical protein LUG18_12185 [Candidatus Azobacteroides sp.]|nr:hypothetical protein [Candidatus Azobacteroides sp.]